MNRFFGPSAAAMAVPDASSGNVGGSEATGSRKHMNKHNRPQRKPDDLLQEILNHPKIRKVKGPDARGEYIVWCVFHPDGRGKKLPHRPNLHISERGYICHACGAKGGLPELAEHLGISVARTQSNGTKVYDYTDEHGKLLHQVVRLPGKQFRQCRPDGKGGCIWNLKGVRRVPYRLHELVARPGELVFIAEGERDCDRLASAGLLSTCNSGGAGKWRKEHNKGLESRDVVILPDNDEPGRKHAIGVARSLWGTARSRIVELPDLPESGDVSDWLDSGHTIDELKALVEKTASWEPDDKAKADSSEQKKSKEKKSQDGKLARLVIQAGVSLFHDERSEPYALIPVPDGRRILPVESKGFERWASRLAWKELQITPSRETLASALRVISARACFDSPEHKLHVRCAWHDGAIWVDLDGQRAVRVKPGKWEIMERPPILFRSFPHQKPLPDPVEDGDPWRVLDFLNLRDPDDKLLLMCYVVGAFVPDISTPALLVHGVQGSTKTTLLKVVRRLLDPSGVEVRGGVRDQTEFAQAAFQSRALFFDNLTSVPDWLSDALCRTVTGEGWSKRRLYTDEDSVYFEYQRVIGLSGINLVAGRADLLDRAVIISLDPVPPDQRRKEKDFWREYEEARPAILGGIFDALARAMTIEPTLELPRLPRMADFCGWGAAAAQALGKTPRDFIVAYDRNVGRQNEAALEASPVGQAVLSLMADRDDDWTGTAVLLREELETVAQDLHIDTRSKQWPKTPSWVTRRLREVQPNLLAMGVEFITESGTSRKVTLRKTGVSSASVEEETSAADMDRR